MHSDYLQGYFDCLIGFEDCINTSIQKHNDGKTIPDAINILNNILGYFYVKQQEIQGVLKPTDPFKPTEAPEYIDKVLYVVVDNTKK